MTLEKEERSPGPGRGISPDVLSSLLAFGLGWLLRGSGRPSASVPAKVRRSDPAASVATTSSVVLRVSGAEVFEHDGLAASDQEEYLVQQVIRAVAAHRAAVQRLQSMKDQRSEPNLRNGEEKQRKAGATEAPTTGESTDPKNNRGDVNSSLSTSAGSTELLATSEHERVWSDEVAALLGHRRPLQRRQTRWCRTPDDFIAMLLRACVFAARKHRNQRRKDIGRTPYINHALDVAYALWNDGHVRDGRVILAGVLCHAIGDVTTTIPAHGATMSGETPDELDENEREHAVGSNADLSQTLAESMMEIEKEFGVEVASIVRECWDEKRMLNRFLNEQTTKARSDPQANPPNPDGSEKRLREAPPPNDSAPTLQVHKERSLWSRLFAGSHTQGASDSMIASKPYTSPSKKSNAGMMKAMSRGHSANSFAPLTRMDRKKIESACTMLKSKEAKMVRLADKLVNLREILACEQGRPHGWSVQRTEEYFAWADAMRHRIGAACPALAKAMEKVVKMYRIQRNTIKDHGHPAIQNASTDAPKTIKDGSDSTLVVVAPDAQLVLARDLSESSGSSQQDKENRAAMDRLQGSSVPYPLTGKQQLPEPNSLKSWRSAGVACPTTTEADTSSFTLGVLDTPARRGVLLELGSEGAL